MSREIFISVDVEAAGPIPGEYSMLSIGACDVNNIMDTFYVELRPINEKAVPDALSASKFDMDTLRIEGIPPITAMSQFKNWIVQTAGGNIPVFVGFNACFDWSFVNWYFHKYLGENPFGYEALDIKAFYMGLSGCTWGETKSSQLPKEMKSSIPLTHNALDDAMAQAEIFNKMLAIRNASL